MVPRILHCEEVRYTVKILDYCRYGKKKRKREYYKLQQHALSIILLYRLKLANECCSLFIQGDLNYKYKS